MQTIRDALAWWVRSILPVPPMPDIALPWGSSLMGLETTVKDAFEIVYYTGAGDGLIVGIILGIIANEIVNRMAQRRRGNP